MQQVLVQVESLPLPLLEGSSAALVVEAGYEQRTAHSIALAFRWAPGWKEGGSGWAGSTAGVGRPCTSPRALAGGCHSCLVSLFVYGTGLPGGQVLPC